MFQIQITGLNEAQQQIQAIATRASNLTPIAPVVYEAVAADVAQRFASAPGVRADGVVYGGVEWRSLTDAYIKAAKREGGTQLFITGALHAQFQVGGDGNVAEATADTITFGAEGGKVVGLHNKRPIIVVHPELVQNVSDVLGAYVAIGES